MRLDQQEFNKIIIIKAIRPNYCFKNTIGIISRRHKFINMYNIVYTIEYKFNTSVIYSRCKKLYLYQPNIAYSMANLKPNEGINCGVKMDISGAEQQVAKYI